MIKKLKERDSGTLQEIYEGTKGAFKKGIKYISLMSGKLLRCFIMAPEKRLRIANIDVNLITKIPGQVMFRLSHT